MRLRRALVLLALLAASCSGGWHARSIRGLVPSLELNLASADGRELHAADFRGHTVLLFFGYTNCPDVCPTTLAKLQQALGGMGEAGRDVRVLFVTVDPARDTAERVQRYASAFGPQFVGLRGSDARLQQLGKRYRVTYSRDAPDAHGDYAVTHSSAVFAFDGEGRARLLFLPSNSAADIAADLQRLAGEG
jgi:protein SCO1